MKNLYQEILFECRTPRHRAIAGQMRFWHIHLQKCYPGGCESDDGRHVPELLVSQDEYREFLERFRKFRRWVKRLQFCLKVSFAGVIDRIYPYFSVSMLESSPIFKRKGFVIEFKECMLRKEFFEDAVYVLVDRDILDKLNLDEHDTVSGSGRFHIDERGIITLDKVSNMRLIDSLSLRKENRWDKREPARFGLRMVDYLYQDICMECPYHLLAAKWSPREKKYPNIFICSLESCIYQTKENYFENNPVPVSLLSEPENSDYSPAGHLHPEKNR